LKKKIEILKQRVADLEEKLASLMRRLGLNSTNSSKPPASEGLSKPQRTQSTRGKGKNPSGGQKGHIGHTLQQTLTPDHVQTHDIALCNACGLSLEDKDVHHTLKRQVFDIPEPKIEVTEHQATTKYVHVAM